MEKAPAIDAVFGDVLRNVFDHVDRSHSLLPGRAHKNPCGNKILDWLVLDNLGNHSVFEQAVLPHLDAAYNLARWLTRNDHDAQDVVQEAVLRAFRFFDTFQGGEARHWFLKIVRNTFYSWYDKNKRHAQTETLGDEAMDIPGNEPGPEEVLVREHSAQVVRAAIETLAVEFREVL